MIAADAIMAEPYLLVALGSGAAFFINLSVIVIGMYRLGAAVGKFELIGKQQASEISELKDTVKEVAALITNSAVHTTRLDNMSTRLGHVERLMEDLRRGEGYILPLKSHKEL